MYKDVASKEFPKTLVIRNHVGGLIWQIYHVDNEYQAYYLAKNAKNKGFEEITLEDYNDYEETFPNWRVELAKEFVVMLPNQLLLKI